MKWLRWIGGVILLVGGIGTGIGQTAANDDFLLQFVPNLIATLQEKVAKLSAEFSTNISSGEAPLTVQFDAAGSNPGVQGIENYIWDFGDGGSATGIRVENTYSLPDSYTASLTIKDAEGQLDQTTRKIEVQGNNINPTALFETQFTNDFAPKHVTFDSRSSFDSDGTITSYAWNFGDGEIASGGLVTHIYNSIGFYTQYTASLVVTDDRGASNKAIQQIVVNQSDLKPVAAFVATPVTGDVPLKVRFDASESSDADGYLTNYDWDFGDGHSASGIRPKHRYETAGNYVPSLMVTDNTGATRVTHHEITVAPANLTPEAVFSYSPLSTSTYSMVHFDASPSFDLDGSISAHAWDFGDGSNAQGISPSHTFSRSGIHFISLIVTDDVGAVGVSTQEFLVAGDESQNTDIVITTQNGMTEINPKRVQGIAPPRSEVYIYNNEALLQSIRADENGLWQLEVALTDGENWLKAVIDKDGSEQSYTILLAYVDKLSRDLTGLSISEILVLTPGLPALPYTVRSGNLHIAQGGKLVLQAGTEIQFDGGRASTLQVDGDLEVNGTQDRLVLLTSDNLDDAGVIQRWAGINANSETASVNMTHAIVEHASKAVRSTGAQVVIKNSEFRKGRSTGSIWLSNTAGVSYIAGSRFSAELRVSGPSEVVVQGNTFDSSGRGIDLFCTDSGCPQLQINQNNLISGWAMRLNDNVFGNLWWRTPVNAQQNWWGTTDLTSVRSRSGADNVDFRNYLDGPVPGGQIFQGELFDSGGSVIPVTDETTLLAGQHYTTHSDLHVPYGATMTLEAGSVLTLDSDILSEYDLVVDGSLVIEAGARIELTGLNSIKINGTFQVNGTALEPVIFTSVQENPGKEDWRGILISSGAEVVHINHAIVEYATYGVKFEDATGSVQNSLLSENKYGVYIKGDSKPLITGNTITSNDYGIYESSMMEGVGPDPEITRNNLNGNSQYGVMLLQLRNGNNFASMPENWWGSKNVTEILGSIYDHRDDEKVPAVGYQQYLDGPTPGGAPVNDSSTELLEIREDRVFASDKQYLVIGDIYVPQGVTLTLDTHAVLYMSGSQNYDFDLIVDGRLVLKAGSKIVFSNSAQRIQINGSISVEGTQMEPVTFTSGQEMPAPGDWQGIHITRLANFAEFEHAIVEYANRGIWFDETSGVVSQSVFIYNNVGVLGSLGASPLLSENEFVSNMFDVQLLADRADGSNHAPDALFSTLSGLPLPDYAVNFDASSSHDREGPIVAFSWDFGDGERGSGITNTHRYSQAGTYAVSLAVLDANGATGTYHQLVLVESPNIPPIAKAGEDQLVEVGVNVNLDGWGSSDPDGTIVNSLWSQIHGPSVHLVTPSKLFTLFAMPELQPGETLAFELSVTDNRGASSNDTIVVSMLVPNVAPVAYAGSDRRINADEIVTLQGYGDDQDGTIAAYSWTQTDGPPVLLNENTTTSPFFTMPELVLGQELIFQLTVTDNIGATNTDSVSIGRVKELTLYSNVSSGIPPLNVFFVVDSNSPYPVTAYGMDYDGDGTIDETAIDADDFEYVYEQEGVYHPYISMLDDQGVFHIDRITIEVVSAEDEQALIRVQWDAMVEAMLGGDIETAIAYFVDSEQEQYRAMFDDMSSEKLSAIFSNVVDLDLYTLTDHLAHCGVIRSEYGSDYSYPVVFMRDGDGGWKIASL